MQVKLSNWQEKKGDRSSNVYNLMDKKEFKG